MTDTRGISLLELIVVLAIVGVLLAIAGVAGSAWMDQYRAETQMKQMFIDLMNARVGAMQKSRMHFLVLSPTQYTVYEDTNPQDGDEALQTASDRQVLQKSFNPRFAISYPGAPANSQMNFDTRGLVSAGLSGTETTIRVNASFGSAYDCITISATRIRTGAWDGATCVVQ
jgi:prepilin-type N-terminal cleavage/methylation domain-containing protein